ncbi:N-acyl homoserine lactonase family protein [Jiella pacifica]|uniref:MBL fold metallo-hydrolase n=1 Tax=Jiella pacifica TaxID=2696469 RepID=A0A6N9SVR9_9HYPH|nr:N-acyl homoserine lactonase family protein [Jiella pacifica]NDW03157.1 MBL fold metallo-hydrolase [Jiella pacifica]
MPEPFELFALRYANHGGRKQSDNFIGGDPHENGADLDYYVWVARRSDRLFVIDTGFGPEAAARRGRTLLRSPAEALHLLGIDAAAVDDVILTHLHYDHAGTPGDFPAARFHLQDGEMAFATGRCMCHAHLAAPFEVEDVVTMVRRVFSGQVIFHDGVETLCDGLSLHRVGGHSSGLQVVRVFTRRGWVVIASDASHLYANMGRGKPFPIVVDVAEMLDGFRRIRALADSDDHVIPGHDPLVMHLYPPVSPALEGIAVRLDMAQRQAPC